MESWRKELYHHGILGQKWGVRRFQNKDGSLTSAGRKRYLYSDTKKNKDRYEAARKYLNQEYDTDKDKTWAKRDQDLMVRLDQINRNEPSIDEYYDKSGNLTEKARKWSDAYDEWQRDYNSYEEELRQAHLKEREQQQKDMYKESAFDIKRARGIKQKLTAIEKNTIGENSEYFNKAYKEYAAVNGGPDTWWIKDQFIYEEWRKGRPAYDAAKKEYDKQVKGMDKEYDSLITKIGEKAFGPYLKTPINKMGLNATEAKGEIEDFLSKIH